MNNTTNVLNILETEPNTNINTNNTNTNVDVDHSLSNADHFQEPRHHSMSACDKLTMDTMMNMEAYSKYISRRSQAAVLRSGPATSERKFYRRRIIDTTKEMLRDAKYVNDGTVTNTFNAYVNACIMHYKFIDLADTIQDEYTELSIETNSSIVATIEHDQREREHEHAAACVMKMNKLCFNPKVEESKTIQIRTPHANAIERLFLSKPESKKTDPDPEIPCKMSAIPRTKDIDIKDAHFKTKGIKSKPKTKNKESAESIP